MRDNRRDVAGWMVSSTGTSPFRLRGVESESDQQLGVI